MGLVGADRIAPALTGSGGGGGSTSACFSLSLLLTGTGSNGAKLNGAGLSAKLSERTGNWIVGETTLGRYGTEEQLIVTEIPAKTDNIYNTVGLMLLIDSLGASQAKYLSVTQTSTNAFELFKENGVDGTGVTYNFPYTVSAGVSSIGIPITTKPTSEWIAGTYTLSVGAWNVDGTCLTSTSIVVEVTGGSGYGYGYGGGGGALGGKAL